MTNQLEMLNLAKTKLVDMSANFVPLAIKAVLILGAGFFITRWLMRVLQRWLGKLELEPPVRQLLLRVGWIISMGVFLVLALTNLGIDLLPIVTGLGVLGAGIAFAMQGVLGNLFAGLTIIFTKPFRVGEYVSMVGVEGRVEDIKLFNTVLSHADMSCIVVPNRKIIGEILHNYGGIRQLDIVVSVAYSTDLNAALAVVRDVLAQNPRTLKEPAPVIRVALLADSSINIAVQPWVNVPDYGPAIGEINQAMVEAFRARAISIPFPQREIRLLTPAA